MEKLTLRIYPDPILRQEGEKIHVFDAELRELASAMIETMERERGIGLAAPQIGLSKRLIVALQMRDADDTGAEALVLVNPTVVESSSDTWSHEEGCLSIPGINAPVIRSRRVEVEFQDLDGKLHRLHAEDMFARILLHEIDHINGRLFIDYLSTANKSLIKSKLKQLAQEKE